MNSGSSPQVLTNLSSSVSFTPFASCWIPKSARLVVLGENPRRSGSIEIYKVDVNADKHQLTLVNKHVTKSGQKCGSFKASPIESRQLATGDFSGHLQIWDLEKLKEPSFEVKAHESVINAVAGCGGLSKGYEYGAPEIATCSRDGFVKVWDPRQTQSVVEIQPFDKKKSRDCWCVSFGNCFDSRNRCVVSGYDNGDVKLLDLRMNKVYWETNVNNGVVSLDFDRTYTKMNKLLVTTLESCYRVYDCKTKHSIHGFAHISQNAHKSTIWQGKHLPQNRDLWCTCGGNGSVKVWKYVYPSQRWLKDKSGEKKGVMGEIEMLAEHKIGEQPIVSWDWNADRMGLACCVSLDQSLKVLIVTKLNQF